MTRRDGWGGEPAIRLVWNTSADDRVRMTGISVAGEPLPGEPRLRVIRQSDQCHRPMAPLQATLQRWRALVQQPLWTVEVAWFQGLATETGDRSRLVFFPHCTAVRLDVDASLSAVAAAREVCRTLAELLAIELTETKARTPAAHRADAAVTPHHGAPSKLP